MKKHKKFSLWTLILVVSICYFGYTLYHQQIYIEQNKTKAEMMKKNIHAETVKNQQLKKQKSIINTNEFAEKIARDQLGYVKNGEKIYIDTNK